MTVRSITTLKTNMPIGTPGGTSAQDIHDLAESAIGVLPYVAKTATYTATDDDETIACDASGGAITINLPAAATTRAGKVYVIKKTDSSVNAVIVDGNSSELVDLDTTQILFTQNAFIAIQNTGSGWIIVGQRGVLSGAIWASTAQVQVANTTTETTLIGAGVGNLTLPANFYRVSRTLEIIASGFISVTGTPTLNIRLKHGSTTVISTGAVATVGTLSQHGWMLRALLTCQSVGAGGVIQGGGSFDYDSTVGEVLGMVNTSGSTLATTASHAIGLTAQWGAADPANIIRLTNLLVRIAA